jgi:hypothetical protein
MTEQPKSKWYWRLLRRGLIALAVLVTLVGILVTEEDWRGKHDWEAYKRATEARGERFDWAAFTPANVPDADNFFAAPIVAEALKAALSDGTKQPDRLKFDIYRGNIGVQINQSGAWHKATVTDLKQWQTAFRSFAATPEGKTNGFPIAPQPQTPAADVLLALSLFNPALDEFRQASERPGARLPLNYAAGFDDVGTWIPWLASTKRCAQFLQLRTLAELDAGQSGAALADVKLLLRLTDTLRNQPFFITHLVRIAIMADPTLQPVYEGLARHRWNDAQLTELENALAAEDFLRDFEFALRGERTCAIDTFERQRLTRQMESGLVAMDGNKEMVVTNSLRWMPSAYFYQNELAFARMYDTSVLPVVDLTNRTVSVAAYLAADESMTKQGNHWFLYTMQARMLFPALGKSVLKFASIQADVDLARVACALERYRLARGEYPATLDVLAPGYITDLPHDIISGQPLHYRRTDDGQYVLYSVGWNEKDDGGTVVLTKNGSVNREAGDWVWRYPAK